MLISGLILTTLLGLAITLSISQRLKIIEVLGLSFLLGIGAQMFLMVALDWCNIRLTALSTLTVTSFALVGCCVYLFFRRRQLQQWWREASKFNYPHLNWGWLLGVAAIATISVVNVAKTLYFPTFDEDSYVGYDYIGTAIAREGSIKSISIDDEPSATLRQFHNYPPLSHTHYAYVYMLGATTSKSVNALIFVSFVLLFYGVVRRFVTPLLAALATAFMLITPEFLGFSSMSGNNFTHAVYASLGIMYFVAWFYKKENSLLWISLSLLMLNSMTRSEGIAFIGAADVVMLWYALKNKQYRTPVVFAALSLFPFIFWQLFIALNGWGMANSMTILKLYWDGDKISTIVREVWALLKSLTYYGLTFVLFFFVVLSNAFNVYKRRDHTVTLLLILLAYLFYNILFYHLEYGERIVWFIRWSYKRFLFSFVPLAWFYIAVNRNVSWLFEQVDKWLFPTPKQKK